MRRPSSLLAILALLSSLTVAFGPSGAPASENDPDVPQSTSGTGVLPNFETEGPVIRLQAGAFDPLADPLPSVDGIPTTAEDDLAPGVPVYWLGQVEAGRYAGARQAIESAGALVAGSLPDHTYVFRAIPEQREEIDDASALRWTGLFQPAWRIPVAANGRSGLLELDGTLDLKVWGFRGDPDLGRLGERLGALDGVEVVEDARWVVHVRATAAEVPAIAHIPSVQWIGQKAEAVPLNAQARWVNDTGIRDVYAATKRLTGEGQTGAAADTALNYAPDLNGRHHAAFDDCASEYLEPPPAGGLVEDCKLADYTQAAPGSDTSSMHDIVNNRDAHGEGAHRKMAAYFDLGGAGRSPRDDSAHGSHVAGSIAADYGANRLPDGEDGMAPGARYVHQNISTPSGGLGGLPADDYQLWRQVYRPRNPASVPDHSWDPNDYANYVPTEDARTHNNSYGLIVDTVDEGSAIALDEFVWDHEDMVIVASAGNSGPAPGSTGSPSVAKNDFTSGASANGRQPMASIDSMASFSSHGPTGDGRLGVDLATPGQTVISTKGGSWDDDHYLQGTSMSGPILTGLATLVREYFHEGWGPAAGQGFAAGVEDPDTRRHNPSAALVKAALANGAERMRGYYTGDDGTQRLTDGQWPSAGQGFGLVNLDNSLYFADDPTNNFYFDVWRADDEAFELADSGTATQTFTFDVQAGEPFDVTLAWTDAPNLLPAGTPALVNDLDLEVSGPSGSFFGNNFNTRANPGAPEATSTAGPPDTRNPVERVRIADPDPGQYTVTVHATTVQEGPQGFALSASGLIDDGADATPTFVPGDPVLVDDGAGGPAIDEGSIEIDRHGADTSIIRFSTNEPTTAVAVLDDTGTAEDEALEFVDVYNRSNGSSFTEYYDTGTVETSERYADLPVEGTEHEILVFGLQAGATYDVRLDATDLADNTSSASTTLQATDTAFQPRASDTGQLTEGSPGGWQTGTQLYAGQSSGSGLLGAYMFRLPDTVDPDEIVGASVEMTGMHVLSNLYDAEPTLTLDLLDESVEPEWGTQDYEQIHNAEADARVLPETQVLEGGQARHVFDFACTELDALRSTLTSADGERRAAFRIDSVVEAATSLPSYEFGFNRRSRGPQHRPRLILHTASDGDAGLIGDCDASTPAPQISDVRIAPGLQDGTAVVSWETDHPSDSVVLFRERGTDEWTQVASATLTRRHAVQVRGVDPTVRYEFGVRSTTCNDMTTTADNGGEGWDLFYPPVDMATRWFDGDPDDDAAGGVITGDPPTGPTKVQTATWGGSATFPENPLSIFWTGPAPQALDAGTDLVFDWYAASRWGNVFVSTAIVTIFAGDPLTLVHEEEVQFSFPLAGASVPNRNHHRIALQGPIPEGPMSVQVTPRFINGDFSIFYGSPDFPSRFAAVLSEDLPEGLPLVGPVPAPSAGATDLDLASEPTRAVTTSADREAGTAVCSGAGLSMTDATVGEDDGEAVLSVALSGQAGHEVQVSYGMGNGTATQGEDYEGVAGTLTFPADGSVTRRTIRLPIVDDDVREGDEWVEVVLRDASGAEIVDGTGRVTIVDDDDGPPGTGPEGQQGVTRLWGESRWSTATDISQDRFADGSAPVVVLARGDDGEGDSGYADALAGTPLAIELGAPLLVTLPDRLLPEVESEIRRLLGPSGRVVLLGGTEALDGTVEQQLQQIGYSTTRIAGRNRIETALRIADATDRSPGAILIARGWNFADALAAGPATSQMGGVVVLNGDDTRAPEVEAYLDEHGGVPTFAIGGQIARLYQEATPVSGVDRHATARLVAERFFSDPTVVGLARSDTFPDSLAGGVHIGALGGPMLLTPPPHLAVEALHPEAEAYVCREETSLVAGYVYGGTKAVSAGASDVFGDRIRGIGC